MARTRIDEGALPGAAVSHHAGEGKTILTEIKDNTAHVLVSMSYFLHSHDDSGAVISRVVSAFREEADMLPNTCATLGCLQLIPSLLTPLSFVR
jgi:hypothetical protein